MWGAAPFAVKGAVFDSSCCAAWRREFDKLLEPNSERSSKGGAAPFAVKGAVFESSCCAAWRREFDRLLEPNSERSSNGGCRTLRC